MPTSPGICSVSPFWGAGAKLRYVSDHRRFGYLPFHQLGTPSAREPLGEAGTSAAGTIAGGALCQRSVPAVRASA